MKLHFTIFLLLAFDVKFAVTQDLIPKTSPEGKKYTFENCINQFDSAKIVKTAAGFQYWFIPQNFLEDGQTVKMSVVGPGQASHVPHRHQGDEIFFILKGTARFYLNGQATTGEAYSSFYCPENSEHGISNGGKDELRYLVIRKYPVN